MQTSTFLKMWQFPCFLIILLTFFIDLRSIEAQVDFNQKQSITINENSGPLLILKNQDASAFTELQLINDQSKSFSMGISGSTNLFFNNVPQTPYLYNGSNQDFQFWSANSEAFDFYIDQTERVTIDNTGLIMKGGNHLSLSSLNAQDVMSMGTNNLGQLVITRNGVGGTPSFIFNDDNPRMGINTTGVLSSELQIVQEYLPVLNGLGLLENSNHGIRLSKWNIVQNSVNNLSFLYDGYWRSYIDNSNGNYVNSSDRRLKENIEPLKPCLDKVLKLIPSKYNYRNSQNETIGFIAQDVESIFPELIYHQGQYKALAYDNFAILAIKAIQEQQEIIADLKKQLSKNVDLIEKQQQRLNLLHGEMSTLSEKIEGSVSHN